MVIYRKYRPKNFAGVTGQAHVVGALKNFIRMGRVGHAYLFTGPRGTGKTTLARIFAKALNCTTLASTMSGQGSAIAAEDIEPCNQCASCSEINEGRSLDLVEIDAASHRGIDEVRELREGIKFAPVRSRYKIFVIDEAHQLTKEAFNALLKTLEEPPAHAVFILATTEPDKMLQTILSRVVRFDFRRLTPAETLERLKRIVAAEERTLPDEAYQLILAEAEGSLRDAESLLEKVLALGENPALEAVEEALGSLSFQKVQALASAILDKNAARAIEILHAYAEHGADPRIMLKSLIQYFRRLLLAGVLPEMRELISAEASDAQFQAMRAQAAAHRQPELIKSIERLLWASDAMRWSPYPIIPVEMVVIELAS